MENFSNRNFRRFLASSMALTMTVGMVPITSKAASFSDTSGHWAEENIEDWAGYEVITGYEGNFSPDAPITRGQMAVILNQVMDYRVQTSNSFSDLSSTWYTDAILKLNAAQIMVGSDGLVRPTDNITRQEAAIMIANALHIPYTTTSSTGFSDDIDIATWAKGAVLALKNQGLVTGRGANEFQPIATITRAEVITILSQGIDTFINTSGTYTENADGTVVVNTANVTLQNMTIAGDLILAEGISYGDAYLKNLTVQGDIIVKGGGNNSIYFTDVVAQGDIIADRMEDEVRLVFSGTTRAPKVTVNNDAIIVTDNLSDDGYVNQVAVFGADATIDGTFGAVSISGSGSSVSLKGTYDSITNTGSSSTLSFTSGTVETFTNSGSGAKISLGGTINSVINSGSNASFTVSGTVKAMSNNGSGASIGVIGSGKIVALTMGAQATVNGNIVASGEDMTNVTLYTNTGSSSSSGGSSGGSSSSGSSGGSSSGGSTTTPDSDSTPDSGDTSVDTVLPASKIIADGILNGYEAGDLEGTTLTYLISEVSTEIAKSYTGVTVSIESSVGTELSGDALSETFAEGSYYLVLKYDGETTIKIKITVGEENTDEDSEDSEDYSVTLTAGDVKGATQPDLASGSSSIEKDANTATITINDYQPEGYYLATVTVTGAKFTQSEIDDNLVLSLTEITGNVTITLTHSAVSYKITATTVLYGSFSADSSANAGAEVTITATPDSGYQVKTVTMNGEAVALNSEGAYTFTMPADNVVISGSFEAVYGLIADGVEFTDGIETAVPGDTVSFTLVGDEEKVFTNFTLVGVLDSAISESNGTYTFTMPSNDVSITANYVESVDFEVKYMVMGSDDSITEIEKEGHDSTGSVTTDEGDTPCKGQVVNITNVTVPVATDSESAYILVGFSTDDSEDGDGIFTTPYLTLEEKTTLYVIFEAVEENSTITMPEGTGDNLTITYSPETVKKGGEVTITITPDEGYYISGLTLEAEAEAEDTDVSLDGYESLSEDENGTFLADGSYVYTYTVGEEETGITSVVGTAKECFDLDVTNSDNSSEGTIEFVSGIVAPGQTITIKVTPVNGYAIDEVAVDETAATEIEGLPGYYNYTIPVDREEAPVVTATFVAATYAIVDNDEASCFAYTDDDDDSDIGDLSVVEFGTSVTLTITPPDGMEALTKEDISIEGLGEDEITFTAADSDKGTEATVTFDMPANDIAINVTYVAETYTLTVGAMTNGSVEIKDESGLKYAGEAEIAYGTKLTITATPDLGYELDSTGLVVKMGEDAEVAEYDGSVIIEEVTDMVSVGASFEAIEYGITVEATNGEAFGDTATNSDSLSVTVESTEFKIYIEPETENHALALLKIGDVYIDFDMADVKLESGTLAGTSYCYYEINLLPYLTITEETSADDGFEVKLVFSDAPVFDSQLQLSSANANGLELGAASNDSAYDEDGNYIVTLSLTGGEETYWTLSSDSDQAEKGPAVWTAFTGEGGADMYISTSATGSYVKFDGTYTQWSSFTTPSGTRSYYLKSSAEATNHIRVKVTRDLAGVDTFLVNNDAFVGLSDDGNSATWKDVFDKVFDENLDTPISKILVDENLTRSIDSEVTIGAGISFNVTNLSGINAYEADDNDDMKYKEDGGRIVVEEGGSLILDGETYTNSNKEEVTIISIRDAISEEATIPFQLFKYDFEESEEWTDWEASDTYKSKTAYYNAQAKLTKEGDNSTTQTTSFFTAPAPEETPIEETVVEETPAEIPVVEETPAAEEDEILEETYEDLLEEGETIVDVVQTVIDGETIDVLIVDEQEDSEEPEEVTEDE